MHYEGKRHQKISEIHTRNLNKRRLEEEQLRSQEQSEIVVTESSMSLNNSTTSSEEKLANDEKVGVTETTAAKPNPLLEPPDPLPPYIKPFEKVLKKDHLYCKVCEIYVNSGM